MRSSDKLILKGFEEVDITHLSGELLECNTPPGSVAYLGLIPVPMYGHHENCYYTEETEILGIIVSAFGQGCCVYIPWRIGLDYDKFPIHTHTLIMQRVIQDILRYTPWLRTDLPPMLEMHSQVRRDQKWQLGR